MEGVEIKEITKVTDRWIKIKTNNIEVVISSPNQEDKLQSLVKSAIEIVKENKLNKSTPGYLN